MSVSIGDKIISIFSYFTFGMFGFIWIIFANVTNKPMSSFLCFNIYQSIFVSVILAIISLLYSIAINLISVIPIIGYFTEKMDLWIVKTPIFFTFTISGFIVTLFLNYLSILVLLGKKPYIPKVSEIIKINFGG